MSAVIDRQLFSGTAIRITESVASAEWALVPGRVWRFAPGVVVPAEFHRYGEPYLGQTLPTDAIEFDAVWWASVNRPPRPEPPAHAATLLTRDAIRRRYHVDPLSDACRAAGFPAHVGTRGGPSTMMGRLLGGSRTTEQELLWSPEAVANWIARTAPLRAVAP